MNALLVLLELLVFVVLLVPLVLLVLVLVVLVLVLVLLLPVLLLLLYFFSWCRVSPHVQSRCQNFYRLSLSDELELEVAENTKLSASS